MAATRAETIRRAEADTVRLSIEIARRVLHRELSVDGSALEALIKAALEKLQAQEVYRVRVHPDQEKLVRACLDQTGRGQAIEVVGDPVQPRGGAVFEISRGALDASVETQLAEIERGLDRPTGGARMTAPQLDRPESLHRRRPQLRAAALDRRSRRTGGHAGRLARAGRGRGRFLRSGDFVAAAACAPR